MALASSKVSVPGENRSRSNHVSKAAQISVLCRQDFFFFFYSSVGGWLGLLGGW